MLKTAKIAAIICILAAPCWADTTPIPLPTDPTGGTLVLVIHQTGTQIDCIEGDGVAGAVTGDVSAGCWYAVDATIAAATPDLPAGVYSGSFYEDDTAGSITPGGADDLKIVGYLDSFYWSGTAAYDPTSTIYLFAVDMEPIIEDIQNTTSFLPVVTAGQAGGLFIAGANAATTVDITGSLSGSVGSVTGAVGSVTGAVGSVTGNVGGIAGTITTLDALDTAQDVEHDSTQSDLVNIDDNVATILTDTNELQTDLTNGGRLDLILDATLADTGELQTDHADGGRLDLIFDATLADTNELQGDWVNGGRLDLLVDSILADTTVIGTPAGVSIAADIAAVDDAIGDVGGAVQTPIELTIPEVILQVARRTDGTLYSPTVIRIAPGEVRTVGWDCNTGVAMPRGAHVHEFTVPTGLTGDLSATRLGTNGQYATIQVTAAAGATAGDEQWVTVEMTHSYNLSSEVSLSAKVLVTEAHP